MRELQGGKLANFIGIGGGLKALRAEQSLIGKGFTLRYESKRLIVSF